MPALSAGQREFNDHGWTPTSRADSDPLLRLIVKLLARTGIRKSELLDLTVDAVVQIGSAFWLRIPLGKVHNDR